MKIPDAGEKPQASENQTATGKARCRPCTQNGAGIEKRKSALRAHHSGNPLVYSSEGGRACPVCGHPVSACVCRSDSSKPAGDGVVRIRKETKGRRGKTVTLISGMAGGEEALRRLSAELKRVCGSGGSVKDGILLIQGDHRSRIEQWLKAKGVKVKISGG